MVNASVASKRGPCGARCLNVGVLGLGRRWERHLGPALAALPDRFRVVGVCDPVQVRAEEVARRWHCGCAAGPTALLESGECDALVLADAPWYGLWPLELACRRGLPVFCGPPLETAAGQSDQLSALVRASQIPLHLNLAPRSAHPTQALRKLLARELGPARLLTCTWSQRAARQVGEHRLLGGAGTALLDWCLSLLAGPVVRVQASTVPGAGLASVLLELAGGQAAQIVRRQTGQGRTRVRLEVVAERGQAVLHLPGRLGWQTAAGRQWRRFPPRAALWQRLLVGFHAALTGVRPPTAELTAVWRALHILRAAERSLALGCPVPVDDIPGTVR